MAFADRPEFRTIRKGNNHEFRILFAPRADFVRNSGKMTSEKWFISALREALSVSRVSKAEFARRCGTTPQRMQEWLEEGSDPRAETAIKVLTNLGWNFERARPDWQAPQAQVPELPVLGYVQAGVMNFADDSEAIRTVRVSPDLWRDSIYWGQTNPVRVRSGNRDEWHDVVLLQIVGDSMEPTYSPGEIIACRSPKDALALQDGTPCIFRSSEGQTFKILRWGVDGRGGVVFVGEPINPAHARIVFTRPKDVEILFVVVGKLDLGIGQSRTAPKSLDRIPGVSCGMKGVK